LIVRADIEKDDPLSAALPVSFKQEDDAAIVPAGASKLPFVCALEPVGLQARVAGVELEA